MNSFPQESGVYQLILSPDGRRVSISVPEGYGGTHAIPLIVALHWGGPMRPFKGHSILTKLIKPALDPVQAIIVAPDCNAEYWTNPQSEAEVIELVHAVKAHYRIDPHKILLMGYSRGGKGTWYIGARNQDLFAAGLIMSAEALQDTTDFDWRMPLYVIHSRQDEEFDFSAVEATVRALQQRDAAVTLAILEGVTHLETDRFVEPLEAAIPWIQEVWNRA